MQSELEKLEADLTNPLKQRVTSVIKEVSLKNGVDLTTDSSTSNFVYIAREKDLTNEVITVYDQKYPAKGYGAK
jgi:Skp family chaperone for outer membrane proteins